MGERGTVRQNAEEEPARSAGSEVLHASLPGGMIPLQQTAPLAFSGRAAGRIRQTTEDFLEGTVVAMLEKKDACEQIISPGQKVIPPRIDS